MISSAIKIEGCSNVVIDNVGVNGFKSICEVDSSSNVVVTNSTLKSNYTETNEHFVTNRKYSKISRNEQCICGSGKKYKKCCLKILQKLNLENSKSICLLIGNGLNISARKYLYENNQPLYMNTYSFLSWDIKSPQKDVDFLDDLPILKDFLTKVEGENDFEKIKKLNKIATKIIIENKNSQEVFKARMLLNEIKHYIAIAFSYFQKELEKRDISQWEWTKLLKSIENKLTYVISLNYDLVLEHAMDIAKVKYRREGLSSEKHGVGILKPHGSIDYDVEGIDIPISYPMKNIADRNDLPIVKIKKDDLLTNRKEADIILPMEYSHQINYQWIKPGYDRIIKYGSEFTDLIICGVAYWECDRPEIDKIIDSLRNDIRVLVIDPYFNENKELKSKLYSKFGPERVVNVIEI